MVLCPQPFEAGSGSAVDRPALYAPLSKRHAKGVGRGIPCRRRLDLPPRRPAHARGL